MHLTVHAYHAQRRVALLLMCLSATACQTWHVERVVPESLVSARHPKRVRITRVDGSQVVLVHPAIRMDTISGIVMRDAAWQDTRIPLSEIQRIETRTFSVGRTAGLGLGLGAGVLLAIILAYAISCGGGACST